MRGLHPRPELCQLCCRCWARLAALEHTAAAPSAPPSAMASPGSGTPHGSGGTGGTACTAACAPPHPGPLQVGVRNLGPLGGPPPTRPQPLEEDLPCQLSLARLTWSKSSILHRRLQATQVRVLQSLPLGKGLAACWA